MICRCGEETTLISVWDDTDQVIAFNVYFCEQCGSIIKQNVWKNEGFIIIKADNGIIHDEK